MLGNMVKISASKAGCGSNQRPQTQDIKLPISKKHTIILFERPSFDLAGPVDRFRFPDLRDLETGWGKSDGLRGGRQIVT